MRSGIRLRSPSDGRSGIKPSRLERVPETFPHVKICQVGGFTGRRGPSFHEYRKEEDGFICLKFCAASVECGVLLKSVREMKLT